MRDVHGVFKDYFDGLDLGTPIWEGAMEGVEIVAPEVTSFTVTREWLEKLRMDAGAGSTSEVRDKVLAAVNEILPPKSSRVLPIEVVADAWTDNWGGDRRGETAMHLASIVVGALRDHGYRIVEASDGD